MSRTVGSLRVVALPEMNRMQLELVAAAVASARRLGIDAVETSGIAAAPGWLLGIGTATTYRTALAAALPRPDVTRIAWTGEPMLAPGDRGSGPWSRLARSAALSHVRLPTALRGVPLPGPVARARSHFRSQKELSQSGREIPNLAEIAERLVVTSRDVQAILSAQGVDARAIPFGYEQAVHGALAPASADRELDLVSLASHEHLIAPRRAEKIAALLASEPRLRMAEHVWGEERNLLLRRARVVVNVQRIEGTFIGLRLVLALAAGAVVVTEPMADPHPFVAGVHFVEAPLERLLPEARGLLADEARRQEIVAAGQELLAGELSMTRCLQRVLD